MRLTYAQRIALQMSDMHWAARHEFYDYWRRSNPRHVTELLSYFSPDELLEGTATGVKIQPGTVIALPNRTLRPQMPAQ